MIVQCTPKSPMLSKKMVSDLTFFTVFAGFRIVKKCIFDQIWHHGTN